MSECVHQRSVEVHLQKTLVSNNLTADKFFGLLCRYYMLLVIINKQSTVTLTDKTITMLR